MKKRFVLDACALIAFLNDEEGADEVEKILQIAKQRKAQVFMNQLNLLEVAQAKTKHALLVTADHHELDQLEQDNEVDIHWIR